MPVEEARRDAGRILGWLPTKKGKERGDFLYRSNVFTGEETIIASFGTTSKPCERAGGLDPGFKPGWLGLIYLNCRAGLRAERTWLDELSPRLQATSFGSRGQHSPAFPEGDGRLRYVVPR